MNTDIIQTVSAKVEAVFCFWAFGDECWDLREIVFRCFDVVAEESSNNHYHTHIEYFPVEKSLLIEVRDELVEIASDMTLMEST